MFSAIIHIEVTPERRSRMTDLDHFHACIRGLFLHRRKLLRTQILSILDQKVNKSDVDAMIRELGLDPQSRAEQLDVSRLIMLAEAIRSRFPASVVGGSRSVPEETGDQRMLPNGGDQAGVTNSGD